MNQPTDRTESHRWLMFDITPQNLIGMFRMMATESMTMKAAPLPPDLAVVDAVYDDQMGFFRMVLQSDFFDPIDVTFGADGTISAAWPRFIFKLEAGPDDEDPEESDAGSLTPLVGEDAPTHDVVPSQPPITTPDDVLQSRWQLLRMAPVALFELLQGVARTGQSRMPALPDDLQIVSAFVDERGLGIIVQSEEFDVTRVRQYQTEKGEDAMSIELDELVIAISAPDDEE